MRTILRTRAVTVRLTPGEHGTLLQRAAMHRLTLAAYVRLAALDGDRGVAVRDANTWWAGLSGHRRAGVHAWLTEHDRATGPVPGQLLIGEQREAPDAC